MNFKEVFNESTILCIAYIQLAYTDWMPTNELRFNFGWFQISIMILNLLVNYILITRKTFRQLLKKFRRWYAIRCLKQIAKKFKPDPGTECPISQIIPSVNEDSNKLSQRRGIKKKVSIRKKKKNTKDQLIKKNTIPNDETPTK